MQELTTTIRNKVGLHARPAAQFVKCARAYHSRITVKLNGRVADAKSILTLLTLGASQGSVITLQAEGDDEAPALSALQTLVDSNFGEPE